MIATAVWTTFTMMFLNFVVPIVSTVTICDAVIIPDSGIYGRSRLKKLSVYWFDANESEQRRLIRVQLKNNSNGAFLIYHPSPFIFLLPVISFSPVTTIQYCWPLLFQRLAVLCHIYGTKYRDTRSSGIVLYKPYISQKRPFRINPVIIYLSERCCWYRQTSRLLFAGSSECLVRRISPSKSLLRALLRFKGERSS